MGRPPLSSRGTSLEPCLEGEETQNPSRTSAGWLPMGSLGDSAHASLLSSSCLRLHDECVFLFAYSIAKTIPVKTRIHGHQGTTGGQSEGREARTQPRVEGAPNRKPRGAKERLLTRTSYCHPAGRTLPAPWPQFVTHEREGNQ